MEGAGGRLHVQSKKRNLIVMGPCRVDFYGESSHLPAPSARHICSLLFKQSLLGGGHAAVAECDLREDGFHKLFACDEVGQVFTPYFSDFQSQSRAWSLGQELRALRARFSVWSDSVENL